MIRPLLLLIAFIIALWPASPAGAQTPVTRIMPLGDSITDGSSYDSPDGSGGYRGPLYTLLSNGGYNVDYVGSLTVNSGLLVQKEHEGHSGWRIDQLDTNMTTWLATFDPDVVLMHIGTNDFGQNFNTTTAIDRLDGLILKIATLRPNAHIIVTNLMQRSGTANTNILAQFNPYVQGRVAAHAAAGRRVTFLDMRSVVPLADMPDSLHPNQTGYNKMANAWFPAIQAVLDPSPPTLSAAVGSADRLHVAITFSKPVADSTAAMENFALSGGLTVSAAVLDTYKRVVTLTTSLQTIGTQYTATVNGVVDRTVPIPLPIAPDSTISFLPARPRGYLNNVPESLGYTLAYSLDISSSADFKTNAVPYTLDSHYGIGAFSRVAYYLELQQPNGELQFLWASMNAFTDDTGKIAVPTIASGAVFQQPVTGLHVFSNVPGITTGTGLSGNLEFWPTNSSPDNALGIAGASESTYDFGDTRSASGNYGSMQLHNAAAGQTLFGFNNWGGNATSGNIDLGLGNHPAPVSGGVDWTNAHNAAGYSVKSLQVLVQTTGDLTPPALVTAVNTFGRTTITVTFSEPLAAGSLRAGNFSINGAIVLGATLAANQRDVILTTTTLPAGALTLTVSGVRDTSPSANQIAAGSTIAISMATLPPEILANVGAAATGYELVYSMNIPAVGNFTNTTGVYTVDNHLAVDLFSRVAYYLELRKTGDAAPAFIWASMNAFTTDAAKIGIPTPASGAIFQQNITSLNVVSNAAGIITGTGMTGGNIEFWPGSYTAANGNSVPNASASTNDFGDTRTAGTGYGSMQVHNHDAGAKQTLFALNHWGVNGTALCLGIGNNPNAGATGPGGTEGPDWTFADNVATYDLKRVLHVLVLPGADTTGPVLTAAKGSATRNRLIVTFNEPVADTAAAAENFSITGGVTVTGATLLTGQREIALTTTAQTAGTVYTVSATGVRDRSSGGNLILPGASTTFTAVTVPAVLANIPEAAGYNLIYQLAITNASTYNTTGVPYSIDETKYPQPQPFDRVAYCLELQLSGGGASSWVYVSADAFTSQLGQIGVPATASGAVFQQNVANLNVFASAGAPVTTGTGLAGGNIEFWPSNYSAGNGAAVANASATNYDFGDTRTTSGNYGSMQIHNHDASQTIFAFNNWGGGGSNNDLGIGNDPAPVTLGVDWTFHHNAATYSTKNLYVLVRPGGTATGTAPLLLSQPGARTIVPGASTTFAVAVSGTGPFYYQWRFNGAAINGATNSWLELTGLTIGQTGAYDVVITGPGGVSTTSQAAILTVVLPNHAPTFSGYAFTSQKDTAATVPFANLLAKASDADGDALTISPVSNSSQQSGTVGLSANGVTYLPPLGFTGADNFTITVGDGRGGSGVGLLNVTVTSALASNSGETNVTMHSDGTVEAVFHGTPRASYVIERSTDLTTWTPLAVVVAGDDGIIPVTDTAAPGDQAFYRAVPL